MNYFKYYLRLGRVHSMIKANAEDTARSDHGKTFKKAHL
jgi:hypothetical protein